MSDDPLFALMREVARTPDAIGLREGDVVGRFELLHEIGRGGFGIVFEARDTELGRLVAVKAMRPGTLAGDAFKLEARAAAALNHPNIVTLHDHGIANETPYLVLERLHGETLAARCARGPLSVAEIVPLAHQIALGLAHAHAAGVTHRDLKPANVFVTDESRAKILDFGLASSHFGGTPAFMAPEQQRGERGDARVDLYSFGTTLHVMATGRAPGHGEIAHAGLRELIAKLCAHDPADRPANARVLLDALVSLEHASRRDAAGQPFRYLEPFGSDDADWFFGRDRETGRLVQMIQSQPLVAVIGPSGAGKTSLIAAGLVPRLRSHESWELVRIRPGRDPLAALTERIAEVSGVSVDLRARPGSAGKVLRERARKTGTRILVFVDAFEELYTTVADRETRRAFADALASCCDDAASPVRVAIAMREDFLSRLIEHGELRDRVTAGLLLVGPPDTQALVEMVRGPVERGGYALEEGLADELVTALAAERAPLPLLQLAASRLWERRDEERKVLPRTILDELGGVPGVLAAHANDVMRSFSAAERETARKLMLLLVTAERTRARRDRSELGADDGVLDRLAAGRLITLADETVELAHESLIEGWDELHDWLDAERETAALRDRVIEAASHWHERGKPRDLLWTGRTLEDAQRRLAKAPLGPLAHAFLAAAATAGRRTRWLRRGAVIGVIATAFGVALAAVIALRAQTRAAQEAEAARRAATARADQKTLDTARELANRDPAAALEALTTVSPSFADWGRLRVIAADALAHDLPRVLHGKGPLFSVLLFDGKTVFSGGDSEVVQRWDVASGTFRGLVGHTGRIAGLARSADGKMLISGGTDHRLLVWNLDTGSYRSLEGAAGTIGWVELSRDEKHVVAGGRGWVRLWDLATGTAQQIRDVNGKLLWNAHYLDGERVFAFWDTSLLVGRPTEPLAEIARHDRTILEAAASYDRRSVFVATEVKGRSEVSRIHAIDLATGTIRLIHEAARNYVDCAQGTTALIMDDGIHVSGQPTTVLHHGDSVDAALLSPSGRYLASTTAAGVVWLTDLEQHTTRQLLGHEAATHSLAFDPKEETLASASVDGTVRLWRVAAPTDVIASARGGTPVGPLFDARYIVVIEPTGSLRVDDVITGTSRVLDDSRKEPFNTSIAVSVFRPMFALAHGPTVRVWNVATGELARFDLGDPTGIERAWVHDLGRVVVRDLARRVWIVERTGHRLLTTLAAPIGGRDLDAGDAEISPDGRRFASVAEDGLVTMWDLDTVQGTVLGRVGEGMHSRVVWASDGLQVGVSGVDKTIHVFRIGGGDTRVIKRDYPCGALAFSPDQTKVASCCGPLGIQVFNLVTGEDGIFRGQRDACSDVSWSADGKRIVSRADNGARLWDVATGESRMLAVGGWWRLEQPFTESSFDGDTTFAADGKSVLVRVTNAYRFVDDLPFEPRLLRAELERIVRERIGAR